MKKQQQPPFFASWILKLFAPGADNFFLSGDFEEIYFHILETDGRFAAWRWYWWQVIISIPHFVLDSFYWRISMFKSYLKVSLRNILRHKSFSFINIAGLSIGMAGTLLILMYVANELSYENFHKKRDRIYRVAADFGQGESKMRFAAVMGALGPAMAEQIPEVENAVRLQWEPNSQFEIDDRSFQENRFFFAEPTLFDIFSFELLQGKKEDVLKEPMSLVISEQIAKKYFGADNPIGQTIIFKKEFPMKVTGIMKNIRENTHLRCDLIASYSSLKSMGREQKDSWTQVGHVYTYTLLKKNATADRLLEKLNKLLVQNTGAEFAKIISFKLQRLSDIYMKSDAFVDFAPKGNMTYVYIFSIVAILVLIIACFNFINLSTAQSLRRLKEVGMRKVIGATRGQLVRQFLGESFVLTTISIILAFMLFYWIYPKLNQFLNNSIVLSNQSYQYLFILIPTILLFVGFFAGGYPAVFVSKYRPIKVLANRYALGSAKTPLRKLLVTIQFALSIILIVGTIAVYKQLDYMKNTDLGFDKENVLLLRFKSRNEEMQSKYFALKNQFNGHPQVVSVSGAYTVPGISSKETKIVQIKDAPEEIQVTLRAIAVDYDYAKTMGLKITAGRDFSQNYGQDENQSILINEEAVKKLNLAEPIGKQLLIPGKDGMKEMSIIGVIRDFHVSSMANAIEPLMLYIQPQSYYTLAVRVKPENVQQTIDDLDSIWKSIVPDLPFEHQYLKDAYNDLYVSEEKIGQLLNVFSVLGIFIACLGLLGLVAFVTESRKKEIGIRKVLGASVAQVTVHLIRDFSALVLISNLIAWPVSWYFIHNWLNNYAYRTNLNLFIFVAAGLFTLFIAVLTLSYQAIKAALANPVESLEYE